MWNGIQGYDFFFFNTLTTEKKERKKGEGRKGERRRVKKEGTKRNRWSSVAELNGVNFL